MFPPRHLFALLLAALLALPAALAAAPGNELSLPFQTLFVERREVVSRGQPVMANMGVFRFSPCATVLGEGELRFITGVGARAASVAGMQETYQKRVFFGLSTEPAVRHVGVTTVDIASIEIKENGRTVALVRAPDGRPLGGEGPDAMVPVQVRIRRWSTVTIHYHLRLSVSDEKRHLPALTDDGRRMITWKPAQYAFELTGDAAEEPPPRPAELRALGSGLTHFPPRHHGGDTFTAFLSVQNAGDLPTDSGFATWSYAGVSESVFVPALPSRRTRNLTAEFRAVLGTETVALTLGEWIWTVAVSANERPRLALLAPAASENYHGDPLELRLVVENRGGAPVENALLRLSAPGAETTAPLPILAPGARTVREMTWRAALPESFVLALAVVTEDGVETGVTLAVARPHRPTARVELADLSFAGAHRAGAAGALTAALINSGTLDTVVACELLVERVADGRVLARRTHRRALAANDRIELRTDPFPYEPGLLRGRCVAEGIDAGLTIDVQPFVYLPDDAEYLLRPAGADTGGPLSVQLLAGPALFHFAPLAELAETDSEARLILPLVSWGPGADPFETAAARPRAAVKVRLQGAGYSDRFDAAGAEGAVVIALPRSALADTLELALEPLGGRRVLLAAAPLLVVRTIARENGAILGADVSGAEVSVRVANRARLIPARQVTLSVGYEGEAPRLFRLPLAPGDSQLFTTRLAPGLAGRRNIVIRLPESPGDTAVTLEQLLLPVPRPRLALRLLPAGGGQRGESGVIALVGVRDNDARGLVLATNAPARRVLLPLVEDAETAAVFLPGADVVFLDYGPLSEALPVPRTGPLRGQLRLLDLGGDSPATGRTVAARYLRVAGGGELPEAEIALAVNGLVRATAAVPPLGPGMRYHGALLFTVPAGDSFDLLLFATDSGGPPHATAADRAEVANIIDPEPFSRVALNWTRPVLLSSLDGRTSGPAFLRLDQLARTANTEITVLRGEEADVITPGKGRALVSLAADTTPMARIAFREGLLAWLGEWQQLYFALAQGPLPVTLEPEDVQRYNATLERLLRAAQQPVVVNRQEIEKLAGAYADQVELLLGLRKE